MNDICKCCGNCKWGEFTRDANGIIQSRHSGTCLVPAPPLPASLGVTRWRLGPKDGIVCIAFEASDLANAGVLTKPRGSNGK